MIKKLRLRYLVTNMAILSCTLIVGLAALFGVLYHTEVSASYTVMQDMLQESSTAGEYRSTSPNRKPSGNPPQKPSEDSSPGLPPNEASPSVMTDVPVVSPLNYTPTDWFYTTDTTTAFSETTTTTTESSIDSNDWSNHWKEYRDPNYIMPPFWDYRDPNYGFNPWDPNQWQNSQPPAEWMQTQPVTETTTTTTETTTTQTSFYNPYWGGWYNPWAYYGDNPWTIPSDQWQNNPPESSQNSQPPHSKTTPSTTRTTESRSAESHSHTSRTTRDSSARHETVTTAAASSSTAASATAALQTSSSEEITSASQLVPVEEGKFIPDAYVAQIGDDGSIESYAGNGNDSSDEEHFRTIHHAMDAVQKRGSDSGTIEIDDKPYRYIYQKDSTGAAQLVLLDRTLEISTLSRLLLIFFFIAVIGLIGMFFLSMLLANWTVTPVAAAWEKQKQFVADASHELKTPLAVISANTEVVLSNPQESVADSGKWLNYIQAETMRMSKLITNLLSVARMDQSEICTDAAVISLSDLVSNSCMVFDPIVFEQGKTLNTIIQKNVRIRAEEDNVRQLLSILLDNAVLHSVPHAQITVSLSQDAQGKIRLAVANTANDIPQEQLSHLFDRFYRIDTQGSPNGSGLGLSIAKSIVHQMGGTLTVTSENQLVTFLAVFSEA